MAPFCFPKCSQILSKINPKMHQIFDRFLHRFFYRFLVDLGGRVGAMLATFSAKMEVRESTPPLFLLGLCYFSIFFARDPGVPHRIVPQSRWGTPPVLGFRTHLGSVFKGFVVHFASFAALFLASILALFSCSFSNFPCWLKGWWGYAKRKELKNCF